jgi:hypothetical protein
LVSRHASCTSRSDDDLPVASPLTRSSDEGGSVSLEGSSEGLCGSSLTLVNVGEADASVVESDDGLSLDFRGFQYAGAYDLDGLSSSTVLTREVDVKLGNGTAKSVCAVLLVHVDGVRAGLVSENNAVVLDVIGILLEDLACGNDFTLDLADLVLTLHVVPELGASENGVTSEDAHSEKLGVRILFAGESSADHVELSDLNTRG